MARPERTSATVSGRNHTLRPRCTPQAGPQHDRAGIVHCVHGTRLQYEIRLVDPIQIDLKTGVTWPKPGQKVKVKPIMAGVLFLKAPDINKGRFGSIGAKAAPYFEPTPAFALVLYRFASWLKATTTTTSTSRSASSNNFLWSVFSNS